MSAVQILRSVPWLPLAVRSVCYGIAVLFAVTPLAGGSARAAALGAVPLALLASEIVQRQQVRAWFVAALATLCFGGAWLASPLLGGPAWLSRLIGPAAMLNVTAVVTFGLLTLGTVFLLRSLAARWATLAVLEGMAIAGVVVLYFQGHHRYNLDQPRSFSDAVLTAGYDPRLILRVVAVFTMGVVGLVLMRTQRVGRTVVSATMLLLLLATGYGASLYLAPDYVQPVDDHQKIPNGDGKPNDDSVSFRPDDWPKNPRPMAIVTLNADYQPAIGAYYFRQNAYSQYNGTKLVRSVETSCDADVPTDFVVEKKEYPCGPEVKDVTVTVPLTISLIVPHSRPFGLTNVKIMEPRPNANPQSFERTYFVEAQAVNKPAMSIELIARACGDANWPTAVRQAYLHHPADPRYRELVQKILEENKREKLKSELRDTPIIKAMAIRRWLEKNTIYWLQADHSQTADPVASFLFGTRKGYCVHVAHAMTYLLRSTGIPARVATGYCVDAGRPGNGSGILVTANDMHAWCEIYVDGVGWVVLDAALERSLSPPPPQPDAAVQQFFNEQNHPRIEPEKLPLPELQQSESTSRFPYEYLIVVLAIVAAYSVKVYRRLAPRWVAESQLYRACYRAVADRLAEVGLTRQFGETREEFAERIARFAPEFLPLTHAHVRQAVTGTVEGTRMSWLVLKNEVVVRLNAVFGRRRRWLGALNPLSWLAVR